MITYTSFIGMDIGKFSFFVTVYGTKEVNKYENSLPGIKQFMKAYKKHLKDGLCILETTGGYELKVLLSLCDNGFAVHRANTRKVKHFILSYGDKGKTDKLDAKALSLYGRERYERLDLYKPSSPKAMEMYELVTRRHALKRIIVAEKNRLQAPRSGITAASCQRMLDAATQEAKEMAEAVNRLVNEDKVLREKKAILQTIPGIGDSIGSELLVLLPELGQISRREIASLVGVAPRSNDSGEYQGYRQTGHGRQGVKPMLFLAAMAARNSNSHLKAFYEGLIARGKKKMVALTALMRKILVIANARLKEFMQSVALEVTMYCSTGGDADGCDAIEGGTTSHPPSHALNRASKYPGGLGQSPNKKRRQPPIAIKG